MFFKKKKSKKNTTNNTDAKPSREEIIAQATSAMQAKREEIGDETLEQIRQALEKRQNDPFAKAKKAIMEKDLDSVLDHLKMTMREDKDK